MILVLDTCAAIEVTLGRCQWHSLGDWIAKADWVVAPDLFISETANVFWKYHQFSHLPLATCEKKLDQTISLIDDIIDSREFYREAFAMSCSVNHPVYDSVYLVVARRLNAYLLTIDNQLKNIAEKKSIKTVQLPK